MAGTVKGGLKTADKIREKYGPDYYAKIGRISGSQNRPETRFFYKNKEQAIEAGRKGGLKSKRRPKFVDKCDICGSEPMTANCNNAGCDLP